MQLFLDTANIEEIRQIARLGIISGVTTNPSLMAKESGADFRETIREIAGIVNGPVSAEVLGTDAETMIKEAREIATWSEHVVIKIPITQEGLAAAASFQTRNKDQLDPMFFSEPGPPGGSSRRDVRQSLRRTA